MENQFENQNCLDLLDTNTTDTEKYVKREMMDNSKNERQLGKIVLLNMNNPCKNDNG